MPAVISEVEQGSPAYEAGLQKGDRITEIAGKKVADYRDIFLYQTVNPGKSYEMEWEREEGGTRTTYSSLVTPVYSDVYKRQAYNGPD